MQRRDFLGQGSAAVMAMAWGAKQVKNPNGVVRMAILADLHHDLIPDGMSRIERLFESMTDFRPSVLLQLGDFALPKKENRSVIEYVNQLTSATIHVLGNHDTDGGHRAEQCLEFWGMPARYYSQELEGIKCIVLDGNEIGSPTHRGGYPSFVGPKQREWLEEQISQANVPVIIISHQPLAGPHAVDNATEMQQLLSRFSSKILVAICGHTHIDYVTQIQQVTYWHVNSASYYWVGDKYRHDSYSAGILSHYPVLALTCPYRESLFASLEIDLAAGRLRVTGQQTDWVGASPENLRVELPIGLAHAEHVVPRISDREWKMPLSSAAGRKI